MAEQLKEIVNASLTSSNLTGANNDEWVLFTNGATTQFVVKDVYVSGANFTTGASLVNNGFTIANNISVSGHEIVDKSSVFKYKLDVVPYVHEARINSGVVVTATTAATHKKYYETVLTQANYPYTEADVKATYFNSYTPATTSVTSIPGMSLPRWLLLRGDVSRAYYFYYDANSAGSALYKATWDGTTVGSWTGVDTTAYAVKAYNSKTDEIVYKKNDGVYKYSIRNDTISGPHAVTGWTNNTTNSKAACANNYFFNYYGAGSEIYVFNMGTNTGLTDVVSGTDLTNRLTGTGDTFAVVYMNDYDLYVVIAADSTTLNCQVISIDSNDNISVVDSGAFTFSNTRDTSAEQIWYGTDDGHIIYRGSTNQIFKDKLDSSGMAGTLVETLATSSYAGSIVIPYPEGASAASVTDYDINMSVKVSGVEITGV